MELPFGIRELKYSSVYVTSTWFKSLTDLVEWLVICPIYRIMN